MLRIILGFAGSLHGDPEVLYCGHSGSDAQKVVDRAAGFSAVHIAELPITRKARRSANAPEPAPEVAITPGLAVRPISGHPDFPAFVAKFGFNAELLEVAEMEAAELRNKLAAAEAEIAELRAKQESPAPMASVPESPGSKAEGKKKSEKPADDGPRL